MGTHAALEQPDYARRHLFIHHARLRRRGWHNQHTYQINASIHNTQWVTGHFHLIFGGAIVIMYFAIAYDLWPHLTGRSLTELRLMRTQLWLWFIGMMVTSFPWHWVGILGMPRRMAYFDFTNPALQPAGLWVIVSAIGGLVLVASGIVFFAVLIRGSTASKAEMSFIASQRPCIHLSGFLQPSMVTRSG